MGIKCNKSVKCVKSVKSVKCVRLVISNSVILPVDVDQPLISIGQPPISKCDRIDVNSGTWITEEKNKQFLIFWIYEINETKVSNLFDISDS